MKTMLAAMMMSISALLATNFAMATPDHERRTEQSRSESRYSSMSTSEDERRESRRSREEHGVKRLQQMSWQPGYVMPQHYRGNRYKIESKEYNLPKPGRNQQWYKINKDYVLVDAESNSIVKIIVP